jgi:hypothetical protein
MFLPRKSAKFLLVRYVMQDYIYIVHNLLEGECESAIIIIILCYNNNNNNNNNTNNTQAYAGRRNSFTHPRALLVLVLHDRDIFLAQATSLAGHNSSNKHITTLTFDQRSPKSSPAFKM